MLPCGSRWRRSPSGELVAERDGLDVDPGSYPPIPLDIALMESVERCARSTRAPMVALGGGLDAAVVLGAWRALGLTMPAAVTLATGMDDYDEIESAHTIAAALGVRLEIARVTPAALVELVPEAVAICETPLYNLHPVARLALARTVRSWGYETLVTGDGADAVFAGRPDADYVPLVAALTRAAELEIASPFFSHIVVRASALHGIDRHKRRLREIAARLGLPAWLTLQPKRSRLMPALDIQRYLEDPILDACASQLKLARSADSDADRVRWATLGLLVQSLGRGRR